MAQLLSAMRSPGRTERGGQVQLPPDEIRRMRENLSTKMVQIQLGDTLRLRIINQLSVLE